MRVWSPRPGICYAILDLPWRPPQLQPACRAPCISPDGFVGVGTWMVRAVRWISMAVFLLFAWSIANGHHEATFYEVIRLPTFKVMIIVLAINAFAVWLERRRGR
jgi:hypothetical protein